jgi:hypothetical protein
MRRNGAVDAVMFHLVGCDAVTIKPGLVPLVLVAAPGQHDEWPCKDPCNAPL